MGRALGPRMQADKDAAKDRNCERGGGASVGQTISAAIVLRVAVSRRTAAANFADDGLGPGSCKAGRVPAFGEAGKRRDEKGKQREQGACGNHAPDDAVFCPPAKHKLENATAPLAVKSQEPARRKSGRQALGQ